MPERQSADHRCKEVTPLTDSHRLETADSAVPPMDSHSGATAPKALLDIVTAVLDDAKADETVTIDLAGKSALADYMIIASGRSDRHVKAIADQLSRVLKERGHGQAAIEGKDAGDWVLIDAGDVLIHVFRPEVRAFYNLEKMWAADLPALAV